MKLQPLIVLLFMSSATLLAGEQPDLHIPEGQPLNHRVRMYVSHVKIEESEAPRLQLFPLKALPLAKIADQKKWTPLIVAPGQTWTQKVEGQSVTREGTLLIFDLEEFQLPFYQSTTRVIPQLVWQPPAGVPGQKLLGEPVYLGRYTGAFIWTVITVGLLVFFIGNLAAKTKVLKARKKNVLYLISGEDGYMSLWRTQLAAWTVAVGGMVVFFGLIQLAVPTIPESLVALMGMAVATGGLSVIAGKPAETRDDKDSEAATNQSPPAKPDKSAAATQPPPPIAPHKESDRPLWQHLISSRNHNNGEVVLSVQKAQMVFWTGIILVLFVVKSVASGELWSVPWELVTLTGVSQLGYLSDKALQRPSKKEP
jgi:hypothetical protein